jgi:hypothetical protein
MGTLHISKTSLDFQLQAFESINNSTDGNLSKNDIYSFLTLNDTLQNQLVTICVLNSNCEILQVKKKNNNVNIIVECISNQVKQNILWKILGFKMDKCEKRYIIMYKRILVGKIEINMLSNTFVLVAKKTYNWSVKNIHQPPKTHLTESTSMTDVLDCLCIAQNDASNENYDLKEFLKIGERHSK